MNHILDDPREALSFSHTTRPWNKMSSFAERYREEGMQKGMQQGEDTLLLRHMERKFGHRLTEDDRWRVETADTETLSK